MQVVSSIRLRKRKIQYASEPEEVAAAVAVEYDAAHNYSAVADVVFQFVELLVLAVVELVHDFEHKSHIGIFPK